MSAGICLGRHAPMATAEAVVPGLHSEWSHRGR